MSKIKVNGKYYEVDDIQLVFPGISRIDFRTGVVTKYPEKTQTTMQPRLIVLLNYLYQRRSDGYTAMDEIINDLFDGYAAEASIKADIKNLRQSIFDQKTETNEYLIIRSARGRGYQLVIPGEEPFSPSTDPVNPNEKTRVWREYGDELF